jgi:prepilin-type N-terminal cleavage/methylation domain-containing protein
MDFCRSRISPIRKLMGTTREPERVDEAQPSEAGFTIVELVVAMAVLAMVMAPLASVFWSAMRTAGAAAHRTDGSSIASREIEGMRAVPYWQVGFYDDQPGVTATFESYTTVSLGTTSPASGSSVPHMQPQTPDPSAATGFAPDPNPANASAIVQGGVPYSVRRYVVWVDAQGPSSTYTQAYKRLTVIVTFSDQAGAHTVRQDSLLYPGGQGSYQGAMGATTSTAPTTTTALSPSVPVLNAITGLADPAGETQIPLAWSQPAGGAAVTSYTVQYSTSSSFPAGNFSVITGFAPSVSSYTVTSLSANTTYYFKIIAYAGANFASSNVQSFATLPVAGPTCNLGQLNVTGAETLSTTGTILQNNGKVSEDLALSWTTTGTCPDTYYVKAVDPSSSADPGSPYSFFVSAGTYSATVPSDGSKSWAIGLHTFTVWDVSTNSPTTVVKTFKICANGSASC